MAAEASGSLLGVTKPWNLLEMKTLSVCVSRKKAHSWRRVDYGGNWMLRGRRSRAFPGEALTINISSWQNFNEISVTKIGFFILCCFALPLAPRSSVTCKRDKLYTLRIRSYVKLSVFLRTFLTLPPWGAVLSVDVCVCVGWTAKRIRRQSLR